MLDSRRLRGCHERSESLARPRQESQFDTPRLCTQPDLLQVLQSSSELTHVNFKNRIKLRDVEQLPNTLGRPEKSHMATLILNRSPDSY